MDTATLTPEQIQAITDREARASAVSLLAQGWDPTGDTYDLSMYHGDLEQLEGVLHRLATRDERVELERMIRDYLVTLPRPQPMGGLSRGVAS